MEGTAPWRWERNAAIALAVLAVGILIAACSLRGPAAKRTTAPTSVAATVTSVATPPARRASPARSRTVETASPSAPRALASTARGMTIYAITNPNATPLHVRHTIENTSGFSFTFVSTVPPRSTIEYHLRDMPQVPSPFVGTVTLQGDEPFTSQLAGYDPPAGADRVAVHWLLVLVSVGPGIVGAAAHPASADSGPVM